MADLNVHLRKFDLFNELSDEDFELCNRLSKGMFRQGKISRGHFLYQDSSRGGCAHFILTGMMATVCLNSDGSQFPSFFYPPGSILGIPHFILSDGVKNQGLTGHLPKAVRNTTYLEITAADLRKLTTQVPALYEAMAKYSTSCYMDLIYITNILHIPSARKRICYYLLIRKRPTPYTVLPNYMLNECSISMLADILGLGRSTVSRELNRMERLGLIELSPKIRILDEEALRDYADSEAVSV